MKSLRWIITILVFFFVTLLFAFLLQLFLTKVMNLGGWKWIILAFWFLVVMIAAGITIAIPAWISPNPNIAVQIIRWTTITSLIISFFLMDFEFNLLAKSNLIYSLIIAFFSNKKHLSSFLKGV
jgi:hypothetical protein